MNPTSNSEASTLRFRLPSTKRRSAKRQIPPVKTTVYGPERVAKLLASNNKRTKINNELDNNLNYNEFNDDDFIDVVDNIRNYNYNNIQNPVLGPGLNIIIEDPISLYYSALNSDPNKWHLTFDRWILLRAHSNKLGFNKLSYTHYWIIDCSQDDTLKSLYCSCKSYRCIHITYIHSNLSQIQFPNYKQALANTKSNFTVNYIIHNNNHNLINNNNNNNNILNDDIINHKHIVANNNNTDYDLIITRSTSNDNYNNIDNNNLKHLESLLKCNITVKEFNNKSVNKYGLYKFKDNKSGIGIKTTQLIPKNSAVLIFDGEYCYRTKEEIKQINENYNKQKLGSYCYDFKTTEIIDPIKGRKNINIIDPTILPYNNITNEYEDIYSLGRYINDAPDNDIINCNLKVQLKMNENHSNCYLVMYAKDNIKPNTELKFDYGDKEPGALFWRDNNIYNNNVLNSNNNNYYNINATRYHVEILREFPDNHLMRRLLIVSIIDKQHNETNGIPPIIVSQNNQLPLYNSLWCRHCCNTSCNHVNICIKYCELNQLKLTHYQSKRKERTFHASISTKTIPKPAYLQYINNNNNNNNKSIIKEFNSNTLLFEKSCKFGCYTDNNNNMPNNYYNINYNTIITNKENNNNRTIFINNSIEYKILNIRECSIYTRECKYECYIGNIQCSKCSNITEYDGCIDGIFNYNNYQLFTHNLLNFYTAAYHSTSYPFNAFVLTMNRIYLENGLNYQFVSNPTFLTAWCSFVKLQDWEFKFECPKCGINPKMLFCDGTSVAIKKCYAKNIRSPINIDPNLPLRSNTYLNYIDTNCYNIQIKEYIKAFLIPAKENKQPEIDLQIANYESYLTQIKTNNNNNNNSEEYRHNYSLLKFFYLIRELILEEQKSINLEARARATNTRVKLCCRLLTILSTKYESLVALINPIILEKCKLLILLIENNNIDNISINNINILKNELRELRPLLYDLFNIFDCFIEIDIKRDESKYKNSDTEKVIKYIKSILKRAEIIHKKYDELQSKVESRVIPGPDNNNNNNNNNNNQLLTDLDIYKLSSSSSSVGKFYSNRPIYNHNQYYKTIDNSSINKSNNNKLHIDNTELCNKQFNSNNKYTGGIMVFWCEHGISYGFHMIEKSEALRDIMNVLLLHWNKAPEVIIYDNACHLMTYCHNREWEYFKNTTFLIDEFHQYNHTGCSEAHSMKKYKRSRSAKYLFINDSVSESGNFGLIKIKPSMYYLQADAGFVYTLTQLEIQNIIKIIGINKSIANDSKTEEMLNEAENEDLESSTEEEDLDHCMDES